MICICEGCIIIFLVLCLLILYTVYNQIFIEKITYLKVYLFLFINLYLFVPNTYVLFSFDPIYQLPNIDATQIYFDFNHPFQYIIIHEFSTFYRKFVNLKVF